MEDAVGDRDLNNLPQISMNLISGSISNYFYIINSTECINMIKQENYLTDFLGNIEYYKLGAKYDRKKIVM